MRAHAGGHRAPRSSAGRLAALVASALVGPALLGCLPEVEPGRPMRVERSFGEAGRFPGQFSYPRAMDHDGEALWIIDKSARVQRLDPESGAATVWWQLDDYEMGKPTGVTVAPTTGPDGTLVPAVYVPDTHYHRVLVFARPGQGSGARATEVEPPLLHSWGTLGTEPGQFVYPTDVAVLLTEDGSAVERVYVSEYGGNDRISVFNASHEFLFSFGVLGDGFDAAALEFSRPQAMAIDQRRRELVVVDSCNHRIGRFTLDGELLGWVGSPDPKPDAPVVLDFPYSIDVLTDSTVLVAEFGAGRVQRLDLERGEVLGSFGRIGRGEGELATPWAADAVGRETFVLDSGNNRVLVTELPGVDGGPS